MGHQTPKELVTSSQSESAGHLMSLSRRREFGEGQLTHALPGRDTTTSSAKCQTTEESDEYVEIVQQEDVGPNSERVDLESRFPFFPNTARAIDAALHLMPLQRVPPGDGIMGGVWGYGNCGYMSMAFGLVPKEQRKTVSQDHLHSMGIDLRKSLFEWWIALRRDLCVLISIAAVKDRLHSQEWQAVVDRLALAARCDVPFSLQLTRHPLSDFSPTYDPRLANDRDIQLIIEDCDSFATGIYGTGANALDSRRVN